MRKKRPAFVMQTALIIIGAIVIGLFFLLKPDWTRQEKLNANNFIEAIEEKNEATKIFSDQKPFAAIPEEDVALAFRHLKNAYTEGNTVTDKVLDKINPQLKEHWHGEFLRGLNLWISAYESPGPDAIAIPLEGQVLLSHFSAWYELHSKEMKMPGHIDKL